MGRKIHSAGIVDYNSLTGRPFGLRQFSLDFLAITFSGESFFMLEEKGTFSKVKPISFVYVPARERHVYDPDINSNWQNLWVLFDGAAAECACKQLIPRPGITSIKSIAKLGEYWQKLSSYVLDDNEISDERAFCMLHNILLELREQSMSFMESQPSPAINEAIIFMRNNLRNPEVDFRRLANKNGICPDSLRKRFKRETGIAMHQYFIQLKINAAKSMLSSLSYPIGELAEFLGFEDQYYFSRLFKKKMGVSPSKYRKNLAGGEIKSKA